MNRSKFLFFPVSLIVVCTGVAISACSKTADQSAQLQRGSIAKLLDAYIDGYKSGDYANIRFAADVTFEGPLTNGKILGEPAVQKFLVKRQIIDGQFACVVADFETTDGTVVPFCEFFRIGDGEIAEIRPYFDPRPFMR